jgi:glycine betaine/proline transport system substrate-binding protein
MYSCTEKRKGEIIRKLLLTTVLVFVVGALVAGCGQGGGGQGEGPHEPITLGYIEWDENVAVSNLTKIIMEEDLNYESVELQLADVAPIYQGIASGDLAAFQDVWMPNHENYMAEFGDDVELLEPWFEGETKYGIGVPAYMEGIQSIADLNEAGTNEIHGIEPGAAFHPVIQDEVIPAYNLDMKLVESSTPAMLSALDKAYSNEEPFVFLPWSPHWMNAKYDIRYLEDPKDAQGEFDDPAKIQTAVNNSLQEDDPMTYEFLNAISLDEEQVNQLELEIQNAESPLEGAQAWLENNREAVQPWIDAAEQAQQ